MTADATIDYESLQQEALRGVVKAVLTRVAKSGLPGDHHLYISFDVRAPGVVLSKRLREKYPSEMTIVLQYRFWDLALTDERFEVKLTFDGIPERLVVPFNAIKVFIDPSVRYVLHFEEPGANTDDIIGTGDSDAGPARTNGVRPGQLKRPRPQRPRPRPDRDGQPAGLTAVPQSQPSPMAAPSPITKPSAVPHNGMAKPGVQDNPPAAPNASLSKPKTADAPPPPDATPAGANPGGQVVSLDAFRKK